MRCTLRNVFTRFLSLNYGHHFFLNEPFIQVKSSLRNRKRYDTTQFTLTIIHVAYATGFKILKIKKYTCKRECRTIEIRSSHMVYIKTHFGFNYVIPILRTRHYDLFIGTYTCIRVLRARRHIIYIIWRYKERGIFVKNSTLLPVPLLFYTKLNDTSECKGPVKWTHALANIFQIISKWYVFTQCASSIALQVLNRNYILAVPLVCVN